MLPAALSCSTAGRALYTERIVWGNESEWESAFSYNGGAEESCFDEDLQLARPAKSGLEQISDTDEEAHKQVHQKSKIEFGTLEMGGQLARHGEELLERPDTRQDIACHKIKGMSAALQLMCNDADVRELRHKRAANVGGVIDDGDPRIHAPELCEEVPNNRSGGKRSVRAREVPEAERKRLETPIGEEMTGECDERKATLRRHQVKCDCLVLGVFADISGNLAGITE
jgi:hypothetical protein